MCRLSCACTGVAKPRTRAEVVRGFITCSERPYASPPGRSGHRSRHRSCGGQINHSPQRARQVTTDQALMAVFLASLSSIVLVGSPLAATHVDVRIDSNSVAKRFWCD
jgi:hypothetical protein